VIPKYTLLLSNIAKAPFFSASSGENYSKFL
jgi:hypothetical protein